MSENQPLLSQDSYSTSVQNGVEQRATTWREYVAEFLESHVLHKIVIALITIDAACVLADLCYTLLSQDCTPEGPEAPLWLELLSHISLAITTLFLVEIPLTLWAFGFHHYNPLGDKPYASLHIFDALIILTTFALEAVLHGKGRELAGLLVVLRLWRLVKLVGGITVGAGELREEEAIAFAEMRKELDTTKAALRAANEENGILKRQIVALERRDSYV
ncbi:hypothetical protein APHAL10511_001256 [Amanita phalloides]|nr:hypothetical protein APHAL10511_001256 [Amanita phalloides]